MPTVLRIQAYRFFFYAGDRNEPPHIHVEEGERQAKFWLSPVRLERSGGFDRSSINDIQRLVQANQELLLRKWDEYFRD